jgi:hypothetical protein
VQPGHDRGVGTQRVQEGVDHPLVVPILPCPIAARGQPRRSDREDRRIGETDPRIRRKAIDG